MTVSALNEKQEEEKKLILDKYKQLLKLCKYQSKEERMLIRKAFDFAYDAHRDIRRASGEPYIIHPLEVAITAVGEIGLGTTAVVSALLHDVVEDLKGVITLDDVGFKFGDTVKVIVDGLTKFENLSEAGIESEKDKSLQAENFKKLLMYSSVDVRIILVKLADRLHNMRTLSALPEKKQNIIASETSEFYAPLSHRLGLYAIKTELEDLSLKHYYPQIYEKISSKLEQTKKYRNELIDDFIKPLKESFEKHHLKCRIIGREKSIHSIWDKMRNKKVTFEEIYDLFAIRIIVQTRKDREKEDCLRIYSIVTDHYKPNMERIRDWISIPKTTGYRAFHTTVMSNSGKYVEVQIRSEEMDEIAEKGVAAHWKYKQLLTGDNSMFQNNIDNWLVQVRNMLQSPSSDALDFLEDIKGYFFKDDIYVFTNDGTLRNLPAGSTVLDFAYAIHTEKGNTCIAAKVNYQLTNINHVLKSGDRIEILTSDSQKPQEQWLSYAKTTRARKQIKETLKQQNKGIEEDGLAKLDEFLKNAGIEPSPDAINRIQTKLNFRSREDLYYALGKNLVNLKELKAITKENDKGGAWLSNIFRRQLRSRPLNQGSLIDILWDKLSDLRNGTLSEEQRRTLDYDISTCCFPIPGDDVVGFFELGKDVKIHRTNCPNALKLMARFKDRVIKTRWDEKETIGFLTGVKLQGLDKKGFISDVIKIITEVHDINILSFHLDVHERIVEAEIRLYVYSTSNLNDLFADLMEHRDIKKVERIEFFGEG